MLRYGGQYAPVRGALCSGMGGIMLRNGGGSMLRYGGQYAPKSPLLSRNEQLLAIT